MLLKRIIGLLTAIICFPLCIIHWNANAENIENSKFYATFIQNWICRNWDYDRWEQEFSAMKNAGFESLIIQTTCDINRTLIDDILDTQDPNAYTTSGLYCMYPTTIPELSGRQLSPVNDGDALALAFEAAKNTGRKIWIGTVNDEMWWRYGWGYPAADSSGDTYFEQWADYNGTLCADLITEIWNRYSTDYSDQIAGWYYVNEIWNIDAACYGTDGGIYAQIIGENINASLSAINEICPEKPLMISPFFNPDISTSEQFGNFISDLIENADFRPIDIYANQDGGGGLRTPDVIREWALAQKSVVDKKGMRFWINNETFHGDSASKPISNLRANVQATADLAERHILFSWNHYYSPTNDPSRESLNEEFIEYAFESIKGDVNCDGVFNVADIVSLQKWLLGSRSTLKDNKAADLYSDNRIDVFDLCFMRQQLLNVI